MEDMDIEEMVDIPDTPDRITARCINGMLLGKQSDSDVAGSSRTSDFRNKECINQPRARSRLVSENGFNRSLHFNPGRTSVKMDEPEPPNRSITSSPLRKPHPSHNTPLFRRGSVTNSKIETWHSTGLQHLNKGKAELTKTSSKIPVHIDNDALFDMAFPRGALKAPRAEDTRDVHVSSNGGSSLHLAPEIRGKVSKGKDKVDIDACNGSGLAVNHGKGIDLTCGSPYKIEKQMNASHLSVTSPRVTGHKRLVRNGCISPYNIAVRQQKLVGDQRDDSSGVGKDDSKNIVSDGSSEVDIRDIIIGEKNEENNYSQAKGKGLVIYPSTSTKHDKQTAHISTSSGTHNKSANETSSTSTIGDTPSGGWRSTHNHARKIFHADDELFADEQSENGMTRRNNGTGYVTKNALDSRGCSETQAASRLVPGLSQTNQPSHIGNIRSKRQKKHGLTSRNHMEHSMTVPEDLEIMFLGSSPESSSSRSSRNVNRQRRGTLHPIYEIDESPTERRAGSCQGRGSADDDADARARQVEADEILARELQEQFYQETPVFGGSEIDGEAAWLLQQEEDIFPPASGQNYSLSRLRRPANIRASREPQPRSLQNPSNRRGTHSRVPARRTSQLWNRIFNRPPAGLSRARNHSLTSLSTSRDFLFPLGMDIDMRLDLLEALEEMSMTDSSILQLQRDFNESDYEMLLALDENNHQHGASVDRINSLPESVVQTDNFEETCAICLESPTIGETIRHLPCLHKFHKDCIDPWLSRKTSCPVCKSSIT